MNEDMHFKKSCKCNKTIESRTQSSKIFSFYSPFFSDSFKDERTVLIHRMLHDTSDIIMRITFCYQNLGLSF